YLFCFSACTPTTSRATRFVLSVARIRSASLTASSISPSATEEMNARSSSSLFFGSAQRGAIELGGGGRVALDAGMARGEIAARCRQRLQLTAGRKLRRRVRVLGRLRRNRGRHHYRGQREGSNSPAIATNGKHHGSL